jgi:hypothetical protein
MTVGASALDVGLTAVVSRLSSDATFAALCAGGVYDAVPQGVTFPYGWLTVRESPTPMETFGRMGQELSWLLQVYDKDGDQEGTKRIDQVIARAVVLLHHGHASLTLTGWNVPLVHYEGMQLMPLMTDVDGQIVRSKLARFRGLVEVA